MAKSIFSSLFEGALKEFNRGIVEIVQKASALQETMQTGQLTDVTQDENIPQSARPKFNFSIHLSGNDGLQVKSSVELSGEFELEFDDQMILKRYLGTNPIVIIPEGIEGIGPNAFRNTHIISVYVPYSCRFIDKYAFASCYNLKQAVIKPGTVKIADHAFCECAELCDLQLPDTLTELGDYTFAGCESLEEINLIHVQCLPESVFQGCHKLRKIEISDSLNISQDSLLEMTDNESCYHFEIQDNAIIRSEIEFTDEHLITDCEILQIHINHLYNMVDIMCPHGRIDEYKGYISKLAFFCKLMADNSNYHLFRLIDGLIKALEQNQLTAWSRTELIKLSMTASTGNIHAYEDGDKSIREIIAMMLDDSSMDILDDTFKSILESLGTNQIAERLNPDAYHFVCHLCGEPTQENICDWIMGLCRSNAINIQPMEYIDIHSDIGPVFQLWSERLHPYGRIVLYFRYMKENFVLIPKAETGEILFYEILNFSPDADLTGYKNGSEMPRFRWV